MTVRRAYQSNRTSGRVIVLRIDTWNRFRRPSTCRCRPVWCCRATTTAKPSWTVEGSVSRSPWTASVGNATGTWDVGSSDWTGNRASPTSLALKQYGTWPSLRLVNIKTLSPPAKRPACNARRLQSIRIQGFRGNRKYLRVRYIIWVPTEWFSVLRVHA